MNLKKIKKTNIKLEEEFSNKVEYTSLNLRASPELSDCCSSPRKFNINFPNRLLLTRSCREL